MEILGISKIKYNLNHDLYLYTNNNGEIKLNPDEAMHIAYAIVDSYGLDYKMLEPLQTAYEEDNTFEVIDLMEDLKEEI